MSTDNLHAPTHDVETIFTGSFSFSNGGTYLGQWKNLENGSRVRNGSGTFTIGPESYTGEWLDDCMNGRGVYRYSSGSIYEGEFCNNTMNGHGKYSWLDGSMYDGSWLENRMHGKGVFTDKDGVCFSGEFFNGMYNNGRAYISLKVC